MQLAKIQRDGRLVLLPDALKHLRGLGKGILVVAVFGGARSAKSTTANMLLGKQSFGMSNTTDACTFGVWIDSRPHEDGKTLLVVDSEGMGKGDTTQHSKILGLVSLLASDGGVLIDNEMKDLGEHNLGTLGVLATMNQMLRGAQKYSWPALVVLLRDFTLTLKIGRRNATPMQYLHHVLEDPGERIDETRRLIRECFQHQNLFTFPPPTEQEHLSMMNLPPGQFKNTFEAMKAYLFEGLTSKTIMEEECDGEKLVDLLETCLEGLNKDTGVDIPSAHEVVVERFCRRLIAQLETKYSEDLPKSALTGDEAKLIAQHNSVQTKLLESFDSETTGFATDRVGQCRDDLVARLSKAHQLLVAENKLLEQKQKQEEALKAHQEQLKAQQEQILKAQQEQNKRNEENNDILERLDSAPRRSPNFMTRPFNKPMTYTSLPLHPEAAQVISDLMVAGDKLRERVEEIEYKQRKQNRLSPTPSSFLPSSPSHPGFVAPQMVIPAPPSQVFMHAPQVVTPSPQFVTPSPQFVTPSPHFMHAPQVAPQMMVQQPSAPPQPVVVVVSSPPSSPQPQPEAHYDPPRQSSSFQLPPTRYQRRLSNNNNADAHAGAGNASANAGQNAGSAGSAGANAGGYAGNAGTAGRISPVFDSVHRVAR